MRTWKKLPKNYLETNYSNNTTSFISKKYENTSTNRRYYNQGNRPEHHKYRTKTPTNQERPSRTGALTERGEKRRFDFLTVRKESSTIGQRTPSRKESYAVKGKIQAGEYSPMRQQVERKNDLNLNERLKKMGIQVGGTAYNKRQTMDQVETIVIQKRTGVPRRHSQEVKRRSGSLNARYGGKTGNFYYGDNGVVFTPVKGKTRVEFKNEEKRESIIG